MADQDKNPRIWNIEEGQAYFDDLIRLLRNPNVSVDETADTGHINATANHFPFQFQKGAPVTKAKACSRIFEYIRVFIIEYKDVISGGHEFREEVETDDLGQLCGMLDTVIRTLPPVKDHEQPERRIVCFIDGVGSRSDVEDSSGVAKVIQTLLKMVRLSHTGNDYVPTFQLICTSPRLGDWDDALFPNGDTCQIIDLALPLLASAPST
ncbi:uncharacterized protein CCOS01_00230 [Colletotrichum costaricense]|uniref:Uncharacterized protein n=1 Tax=Colletotrichum costaricense TaxID=1209916 RepID=A0AAI9ZA96_9PEZI|nr:uncharacterized protein CCOS01_00230 [Colletotrichum costaricense]KAK1538916.1 hypothetical protein CCOS01_00230 [Colletotrichum costaricense]